jgi:hypothetical protein
MKLSRDSVDSRRRFRVLLPIACQQPPSLGSGDSRLARRTAVRTAARERPRCPTYRRMGQVHAEQAGEASVRRQSSGQEGAGRHVGGGGGLSASALRGGPTDRRSQGGVSIAQRITPSRVRRPTREAVTLGRHRACRPSERAPAPPVSRHWISARCLRASMSGRRPLGGHHDIGEERGPPTIHSTVRKIDPTT